MSAEMFLIEGCYVYSIAYGHSKVKSIDIEKSKVVMYALNGERTEYTTWGSIYLSLSTECLIYPSKLIREWNNTIPFGSVVYVWNDDYADRIIGYYMGIARDEKYLIHSCDQFYGYNNIELCMEPLKR